MFRFVDVHAHLDDKSFDNDRDEVIKRASNVLILNAGQEPESNRKSIELSRKYNNVKACLGFHPEFVPNFNDWEIDAEINYIRNTNVKIAAISEIGLDYHWIKDLEQRRRSIEVFKKMLILADEMNLPVIVHSRNATMHVLEILRNFSGKVVLHGFTGNMHELRIAINRGYYFSIAPNVCRSTYKQSLVKVLPMDRLLTETDSPVLSADNKRNEPSNVKLVVQKIAEIKKIEEQEAEIKLRENAFKILNL
ncbi:MAG: TatD family hydrolase [Candidatus Parvarchaeota archaeon]|nr:TatD family hydrolase [Candidatus Jingweiarchaeum tengchongense]MCW1297721.1 TatD family hydrolase [Candidatus Jingweiarchaeum tengchongense]MCW1299731.1 TatD family hydrolase [Candidatus Jingweiarchaeum tengchongense]MCW1304298.1 TatD family hydrolase [Candidatus Jingweiarchaeum tengchongense]MCW1305325.1 TatD family hydrolase [Candidatus Jingweiarchaeum tengchongense]